MSMHEFPQIGDRISAHHNSANVHCQNVQCPEIDGFIRKIGKTAIFVDNGITITPIHLHNGWDVIIHPELTREST